TLPRTVLRLQSRRRGDCRQVPVCAIRRFPVGSVSRAARKLRSQGRLLGAFQSAKACLSTLGHVGPFGHWSEAQLWLVLTHRRALGNGRFFRAPDGWRALPTFSFSAQPSECHGAISRSRFGESRMRAVA